MVGVSPYTTIAVANSSANNPVASFNRLSPSRISTMRFGIPMRLAMEVAAIASVVATTAPNTNPTRQSKPASNHEAAAATLSTVNATSPIASDAMLVRFSRKSRQDVAHAAEYNNGGNTTRKTSSGSRATLGMPGTNPSSSPATTRTIG